MPRVHRQVAVVTVKHDLPHDPAGKICGFHVQAMSIVFGAQFLEPPERGLWLVYPLWCRGY